MDPQLANFAEDVLSARDPATGRERFRDGFGRLRSRLGLHPAAAPRASDTFRWAARAANAVAADCLPFALGIVMHLYPLCALQCVPLPALTRPWYRRRQLVREVLRDRLILANAGSERAAGTNPPLTAERDAKGILVDGEFEYVSLASVADLVLFEAPLAHGNGVAVCAADLRADSVRIGAPRFQTGMRLSDTCAVTFDRHRVPYERCFIVPAGSRGIECIRDYQRCWFHLLLAEIHNTRVEWLHRGWRLETTPEQFAARVEIVHLRDQGLRLLDDAFTADNLATLSRVTSRLKLRASQRAQATAARLRALGPASSADADELTYIRMQPTSDARILQRLVDEPMLASGT